MDDVYANRVDAGRQLANHLVDYTGRKEVLVLALPRGGVPVAAEVARKLKVPLDVLIVRKVGLPENPELAMGAVASGGVEVVNESVTKGWGIAPEEFRRVAARELREVERREAMYRRGLPPLQVAGRTIVLVDDGIATGSTVKAGIRALRKLNAASVVVAVPVAADDSAQAPDALADEVVCLQRPRHFMAVGAYYRDFSQTSDEEVTELLWRAQKSED
ncbi:phosphoribosyltransferase [Gilvimarinus sp. F26214L]|uniref:phosphoribosyltransferase n=1 Tax=Gilvimarinus sp. DZF01 TaxID=3461371 RepID=UPI0040465BDC